jgi:hypothetical protein
VSQDQSNPLRVEPLAEAIPPDASPFPSDRCAWQIIEGEAVILDLEGRKVMGLNAVASFAWGLLDGNRSLAQIAEAAADRFEIGAAQAASDIGIFLGALKARGLVEVKS